MATKTCEAKAGSEYRGNSSKQLVLVDSVRKITSGDSEIVKYYRRSNDVDDTVKMVEMPRLIFEINYTEV